MQATEALVQAIRASKEYRDWEVHAKKVKANPAAEKRLAELRTISIEVQAAAIQGQKPPAEKVRQLESASRKAQADLVLGPYLKAEANLTQLLAQVQEGLSQTVNLKVPGVE